jgi:hypothetical protein
VSDIFEEHSATAVRRRYTNKGLLCSRTSFRSLVQSLLVFRLRSPKLTIHTLFIDFLSIIFQLCAEDSEMFRPGIHYILVTQCVAQSVSYYLRVGRPRDRSSSPGRVKFSQFSMLSGQVLNIYIFLSNGYRGLFPQR